MPLSPRNPRVQAVRRLARQVRERANRRAFVVEGPLLVAEAMAAGIELEVVFHTAPESPVVMEAIGRGIETMEVTGAAMSSMATTRAPQPVLGVAQAVAAADPTELAAAGGHVVLLDQVRDPGNLGTVLRSAEASGAAGVVLGRGSVDVHNPKVVRASAGSIFRVSLVDGSATETGALVAMFRQRGRCAYGTAASGELSYDEIDLRRAVIVMGNESSGVDALTATDLDGWLRIPQDGHGESLNVAMAATVLCFEAARQRRSSRTGQ